MHGIRDCCDDCCGASFGIVTCGAPVLDMRHVFASHRCRTLAAWDEATRENCCVEGCGQPAEGRRRASAVRALSRNVRVAWCLSVGCPNRLTEVLTLADTCRAVRAAWDDTGPVPWTSLLRRTVSHRRSKDATCCGNMHVARRSRWWQRPCMGVSLPPLRASVCCKHRLTTQTSVCTYSGEMYPEGRSPSAK